MKYRAYSYRQPLYYIITLITVITPTSESIMQGQEPIATEDHVQQSFKFTGRSLYHRVCQGFIGTLNTSCPHPLTTTSRPPLISVTGGFPYIQPLMLLLLDPDYSTTRISHVVSFWRMKHCFYIQKQAFVFSVRRQKYFIRPDTLYVKQLYFKEQNSCLESDSRSVD